MPGRGRPPQDGADPCQQLVVVEGPRHVVVAAPVEGADAVDGILLGVAEHDHRDLTVPRPARRAFAQAAAELRGRENERRVQPLDEIECLALCIRAEDVEPVVRKMPLEELPRRRLGLGEEQRGVHDPKLAPPSSAD